MSFFRKLRKYDQLGSFYTLLAQFIEELGKIIVKLWGVLTIVPGKRVESKANKNQQQKKIIETIESMLLRINTFMDNIKNESSTIATKLDEAFATLFERDVVKSFCERIEQMKSSVSQRGQKTYIFPCANQDNYLVLVNDVNRFRVEIVDKLHQYRYKTGHKSSCKCHGKYRLCGFRKNSRGTIMSGGKKEIFPIRIVECIDCGQRFSLLPSFLPREKHYGIDIIGNICRNLFLFHQSLQGILENQKVIGGKYIKSKQTIYNWIRWVGIQHPATVLTKAGIKGSGYFQEDEGFEKEPNLRTYAVVIVEPQTHLVWHGRIC